MNSEIDWRVYFVFVHCSDTNVDVEEESDIFTEGKSDVFNVHGLVDINEQAKLTTNEIRNQSGQK